MAEFQRMATRASARKANKERRNELRNLRTLNGKQLKELNNLTHDGRKLTEKEMAQWKTICSYGPKRTKKPNFLSISDPEIDASLTSADRAGAEKAKELCNATIKAANNEDGNSRQPKLAKRVSWDDIIGDAAPSLALPSKTRWVERDARRDFDLLSDGEDDPDLEAASRECQHLPHVYGSMYGKFANIDPDMCHLIELALEKHLLIPVLKIINDMLEPVTQTFIPPDPDKVTPIASRVGLPSPSQPPSSTTAGPSTLHRSSGSADFDFDDEMDADAATPSRQEILNFWNSVEADRQAVPTAIDTFNDSANDDEADVENGPLIGGGLFGRGPRSRRERMGW